ncbi:transglutaminase-like domain-containing protein [Hathewaya massiliensis]|uniref:transglutaminase-like domain-containing protein n=1 Tax=Hathewaya massiliensis TaxID=1964382 RepID=UPI00115A8E3B|nr:transglutaminase-like domain-containing protein [Hathewaya massiliensis]
MKKYRLANYYKEYNNNKGNNNDKHDNNNKDNNNDNNNNKYNNNDNNKKKYSNIYGHSNNKVKNINTAIFLFQCIIIFISSMYLFEISEIGLLIRGVEYLLLVKLFFAGLLLYILFFKLMKKNIYRLTTVLVFSIILYLFATFKNELFMSFISRLYENFNILSVQIYNLEKTYFQNFKPLLMVVLPLVYILIFYITERFWSNFIVIINLIVLTMLWFINMELSLKYMDVFFKLSIFMIIFNIYFKNIKNIVSKGIKYEVNYTSIVCFIVILSIVVNGITYYLPREREGKIKKEQYVNLIDKFINNESDQNEDEFNLSQVGYSDNYKKLGGSIEINKKDLMKVKTDKPRYLKGTVKSMYDGKAWKSIENEYMPYKKLVYLDIYKISKELENIDPVQYYLEEKNLEVELKDDFQSYSFFSPNLAKDLRTIDSGDIYYDKEQNLKLSKKIKNKYNVSFFNIKDINGIEFGEELLKKDTGYISYMQYPIDKRTKPEKGKWIDTYYYGGFDEIIKTNFSNYMSLPDNISKETHELVEKITKDATTPLEKVNNIKDYLEKNYKYSLNVSSVPENEEFLNYFLFKEKKGYCTYFATAMTVMSRIAGVPARYVEGFKMGNRKDKDGRYLVGSEDAHAWCEVLVYPEKNLWTVADPKVSREGINNINNNEQARIEANNRVLEEKKKQKQKEKIEEDKKKQNQKENITKKEEKSKASKGFKVKNEAVLATIITLACIILLFIIILYMKKVIILRSKSIVPLYKHCMFVLKLMGIKNNSNMSDMEFMNSIEDKNLGEKLNIIVKEAYNEKYGGYNLNIDKKHLYNFINKYMKNYIIGKAKFWN